jgi:Na+/H+ antiporter NhaD/arsenite permease-like protein
MACLLFVPVFKTITHLPPYMGILLSLGVIWIVSEVINSKLDDAERAPYTATHALSRIDTSSVLFFLGILLAIGALEATHLLSALARWMDRTMGNEDVIVMAIGLASAVIDNVPLVAATMGMYSLDAFPPDAKLWEFLAYCAGTGGSILIIGSAAGVAVMGMERIDFGWYLKRISLLALLGYFAGAFAYIGIYALTH